MKSKDLIKELQELDPSGEIEVCVNNLNIQFANIYPAYYDGPMLVIDKKTLSAKYVINGSKIILHYTAVNDFIFDAIEKKNEDNLSVDVSELNENDAKDYLEFFEQRKRCFVLLLERWNTDEFIEWVKSQNSNLSDGHIKEFAARYISYQDEVGGNPNASYHSRRKAYWAKRFKVDSKGIK